MRALPLFLHKFLGLWAPALCIVAALFLMTLAALDSALHVLETPTRWALFVAGAASWGIGLALASYVNNTTVGVRVARKA